MTVELGLKSQLVLLEGAGGRIAHRSLHAFGLFVGLDPAELASLQRVARPFSVPIGETLVRQGDAGADAALYVVLDGLLRVSIRVGAGRDFTLHLLSSGDVFGEVALVDGLPQPVTVTALKPTDLWAVDRNGLLRCVEHTPSLALKLMAAMAACIRKLTARSAELSALPVRTRMARRLIEIGDLCGTPVSKNRVALPLDLSQQDLADHVQTTRESINKCLARWMREGIVHRTSNQLVIDDRARLIALGKED